jgi:putative FmdB family regulatory protein
MPLYEFRCLACESQFELLIRGAATPACPSCGATTLERLVSMFAVSSEGASHRNRASLGAAQRQKSQANRQEQSHYRHDHHDD